MFKNSSKKSKIKSRLNLIVLKYLLKIKLIRANQRTKFKVNKNVYQTVKRKNIAK